MRCPVPLSHPTDSRARPDQMIRDPVNRSASDAAFGGGPPGLATPPIQRRCRVWKIAGYRRRAYNTGAANGAPRIKRTCGNACGPAGQDGAEGQRFESTRRSLRGCSRRPGRCRTEPACWPTVAESYILKAVARGAIASPQSAGAIY